MKDSGARETYDSGMVREPEIGRPRFDLLIPEGVPYEEQFLTRCAKLMAEGAFKYEDRNWEQAAGPKELARFRSSAARHFFQWLANADDEDHAAALLFNVLAYETIAPKVQAEPKPDPTGDDLEKWVTTHPKEFQAWVLKYQRTHGYLPGATYRRRYA